MKSGNDYKVYSNEESYKFQICRSGGHSWRQGIHRSKGLRSVDHSTLERSTRGSYKDRPQNCKGKVIGINLGLSFFRCLPLVSPFAHCTRLTFAMRRWEAVVTVQGNGRQVHYGSRYGETPTPAYTVLHLSASYSHSLGRVSYVVRAGVEDMRDKVTG